MIPVPPLRGRGIGRQQKVHIVECLEFQRIARRIINKHGRLFIWQPGKPDLWFHTKAGIGLLQAGGQDPMGYNLVSVQIEIDPCIAATPFGALQHTAVKIPCRIKIIDRKRQMEGF